MTPIPTKPAPKGPDPAPLKARGVAAEIIETPKRVIASVGGREKTGKTHFGCTGPEPIIFFNIDIGTEGVIGKFQEGFDGQAAKQVFVYDVRFPRGSTNTSDYSPQWLALKSTLPSALSLPPGTVVIDTASEAHELSRLAAFGKLTQVMPHNYGPVNAEWRELIRLAYDSQMNTILIHKMRPKYVNDVRTKEYEIKGFGETGYLVQASLITSREDSPDGGLPKYSVFLEDCRQNPKINGTILRDPMVTLDFLLSIIHPGK